MVPDDGVDNFDGIKIGRVSAPGGVACMDAGYQPPTKTITAVQVIKGWMRG